MPQAAWNQIKNIIDAFWIILYTPVVFGTFRNGIFITVLNIGFNNQF